MPLGSSQPVQHCCPKSVGLEGDYVENIIEKVRVKMIIPAYQN